MAKNLTDLAIKKAEPCSARREIPDGHTRGLFLVIQPTGKRSWAFRYRHLGAPRKLTLGPYPEISLGAARDLATEARAKVARGGDPATEKQGIRQAALAEQRSERDQVEAVVAQFIERHAKPNNREATWKESKRLLEKHVVAFWPGRRLPEITRRDVHGLLDAIMDEGKPILANRVHGIFRKMCGWAVERGIIPTSPCASIKPPAAERSRDRMLDDDELRAVWKASEEIGWPFGPLAQLLVLTGQRRDEVADMRWSEVDLAAKTWRLPRERSKNDAEHVIPLSEAAIGVLVALPRISSKNGLVFTSNGETSVSGFSRAKERLEEFAKATMGSADPLPRWTLHDLRRTAASGMARLGIPVHVVEAVLNHRSGTIRGVARVYNRYSYELEKRGALDAWGRYVEQLVSGEPAANVVELATARASL